MLQVSIQTILLKVYSSSFVVSLEVIPLKKPARTIAVFCLYVTSGFLILYPTPLPSQAPLHKKIVLRGFNGNPLTPDSKMPYSPRKTCGSCHDYNQITNGYHFQQGRTDGTGKITISDIFDSKYPWNLSSGMYGKHGLTSADSSQLAKKKNQHSSNVDQSSFSFIQNCGGCHPGGGFGEYDRKGPLYYNEETKKFGYEISGDDPILDGDYTPLNSGNPNYGASWDRSGVSEADCLICHLKGYQWKERGATLRAGFFRWGPTVGAGWATVKLSQDEAGSWKVQEGRIDYTKKEVADFEKIHLQIVRRVPDENCWFCHATPDGKRKGNQWSSETDVHKARGLDCISCHSGDKEHNFAKGDTIQDTVRDDLDNTMYSCEDCHYRGKNRQAPRYKHPFSPRHLKRIACQTCHIPYQGASADLVYDRSTGSAVVYDTSKFLSNNPLDPKKPASGLNSNAWYPTIREFKGRIVPVKSLIVIYWGALDKMTNTVRPIFLWKIRGLKKPEPRDDDRDGIPEINTLEEIKTFLNALKEKDKFGSPVAEHPVLMKGRYLYQLDEKGGVEKVRHEQAQTLDFSLNHTILSGASVIGSRGCSDCHSKNSPFFLRKILLDPYDETGNPVYIENWERLGIDQERLGRLLMEQ